MTTLEAGGTAASIRREAGGPAQIFSYGNVTHMVEGLIGLTTYTPTPKAHERWALRGWAVGGPIVLVDLGATEASGINPRDLPAITWHHSALHALPADLEGTLVEISGLEELDAGWNGYDVAAPRIEAIHDATEWILQMHKDVVRSGLAWREPHVAADERGDVTFEWWNGGKGLTVYVSPDSGVSYLKDWGPNMTADMEDGPAATPEERRRIWNWLLQ